MPLNPIGLKSHVLRCVYQLTGVRPNELRGYGRSPRILDARYALMWALRRCGMNYSAIGRLMGRDHSTIIIGEAKVAVRLLSDEAFKALCQQLKTMIEGGDEARNTSQVDAADGRGTDGDMSGQVRRDTGAVR